MKLNQKFHNHWGSHSISHSIRIENRKIETIPLLGVVVYDSLKTEDRPTVH